MSDILHVYRGAINGLDGQVVEFYDGAGAAVHFDAVFECAKFGRAGRKEKILRVDGVDDVDRRKTFGLESRRIGIHGNQALLATVGEWSCCTLNGSELSANEIITKVKELLFAKSVAGQSNLNDRDGRGRIDNDQWRSGAGRQKTQEGLRDGGGLSESGLNVGVRLKINLNDGNSVERLRFGMFDVVDESGDAAFNVASNALLHFLGF